MDNEQIKNAGNQPLQLVSLDDGKMKFHVEAAQATFANPEYAQYNKRFASVMGPARSGKSFLMTLLTNGVQDGQVRGNFHSGRKRHTEGLLIFSKPLIVDMTAIFFIDSQGLFDLRTNREISGWIAGCSLLVSDILIVNLPETIGGDHLSSLHFFVQIAAAFPGAKLPKTLLFLIRNSTQIDGKFYFEEIKKEAENSVDLREITESLGKRFESIKSVCAPAVATHIREANGLVILKEEDQPFIDTLLSVKDLTVREMAECSGSNKYDTDDMISQFHKFTDFLQAKAPQLKTTIEMTDTMTTMMTINEATEILRDSIKNCQPDTLEFYQNLGMKKVEGYLKSQLAHRKRIDEVLIELRPKIQQVVDEKLKEFEIDAMQKEIKQRSEEFAKTLRGTIMGKTLEELFSMKKDNMISRDGLQNGILENTIKSLQQTLDNRIADLQIRRLTKSMQDVENTFDSFLEERKTTLDETLLEQELSRREQVFRKSCEILEMNPSEVDLVNQRLAHILSSLRQKARSMIRANEERQRKPLIDCSNTGYGTINGHEESSRQGMIAHRDTATHPMRSQAPANDYRPARPAIDENSNGSSGRAIALLAQPRQGFQNLTTITHQPQNNTVMDRTGQTHFPVLGRQQINQASLPENLASQNGLDTSDSHHGRILSTPQTFNLEEALAASGQQESRSEPHPQTLAIRPQGSSLGICTETNLSSRKSARAQHLASECMDPVEIAEDALVWDKTLVKNRLTKAMETLVKRAANESETTFQEALANLQQRFCDAIWAKANQEFKQVQRLVQKSYPATREGEEMWNYIRKQEPASLRCLLGLSKCDKNKIDFPKLQQDFRSRFEQKAQGIKRDGSAIEVVHAFQALFATRIEIEQRLFCMSEVDELEKCLDEIWLPVLQAFCMNIWVTQEELTQLMDMFLDFRRSASQEQRLLFEQQLARILSNQQM